MLTAIYLSTKDKLVKRIIRSTFPKYKGRCIEAIITNSVVFYGTLWNNGDRRTYKVFNLNTKESRSIPSAPYVQSSALHENDFFIEKGFVVVVLCEGKKDHIEIYSTLDNLISLLPKPIYLSQIEKRVLLIMRFYKNNYVEIPKYREYEAQRMWGINLDQYNEAKTSLIEKKILNRAGAITIEGKNYIKMDLFN